MPSDRLAAFSPILRARVAASLPPLTGAPVWPPLNGCLIIACASRSGSTALCREIERLYGFHRINEGFNQRRLSREAAENGLASAEEAMALVIGREAEAGWFGFKSGASSLVVAEISGFVEAHLDRLRLVLLARRDVVAQAVSLAKAEQTSIWHSNQIGRRQAEPAAYAYEHIARSMRNIVAGVEILWRYVQAADLPSARVFYEDFADGDWAAVEAICDGLGLPRRPRSLEVGARAVMRTGDEVNVDWAERFRSEMAPDIAALADRYAALCEG